MKPTKTANAAKTGLVSVFEVAIIGIRLRDRDMPVFHQAPFFRARIRLALRLATAKVARNLAIVIAGEGKDTERNREEEDY